MKNMVNKRSKVCTIPKHLRIIIEPLENMEYKHSSVFSDWVEWIVCRLTLKEFSRIESYSRDEIKIFFDCFVKLGEEMELRPFEDLIGEIFQRRVTYGENGQFFTPVNVCDFMAEIQIIEEPKKWAKICDHC